MPLWYWIKFCYCCNLNYSRLTRHTLINIQCKEQGFRGVGAWFYGRNIVIKWMKRPPKWARVGHSYYKSKELTLFLCSLRLDMIIIYHRLMFESASSVSLNEIWIAKYAHAFIYVIHQKFYDSFAVFLVTALFIFVVSVPTDVYMCLFNLILNDIFITDFMLKLLLS